MRRPRVIIKRRKPRGSAKKRVIKTASKREAYKKAQSVYNTVPYKEWRNYVFQRDLYTCQMCGKKGVKLEAHHVRPKYLNPELVLDKNNGVCLCKPCHQKIVTKRETHFIYIFDRIVKLNTRLYEQRKIYKLKKLRS